MKLINREVSKDTVDRIVQDKGLECFVETSAKENLGIDEVSVFDY